MGSTAAAAAGGVARGWVVIAAYGVVSAALQVVWLTYAPITTEAADRLGVSEEAVGWLANLFPLIYVVLALPAGVLLDRWFRATLELGALATAVGAVIRVVGGGYATALACAVIAAIAQPLVLNAISKLADAYLPAAQRPLGIAVAAAANLVGLLGALVLGATFGIDGLHQILLVGAVAAVVGAGALVLALRGPQPAVLATRVRTSPRALAWLFSERGTRSLGLLVFAGFGAFIAMTTWLEVLLRPAGISARAAGVLLAVFVGAGVLGSVLLPAPVVRRGLERHLLVAALALTAVGCVVLAIAPAVRTAAAVLVLVGFVLMSALPVILDLTERLVGATGGSTGAAYVYLMGNAGGLVVAVVVQLLLDRPAAAFLALTAVCLGGALFLRGLPRPVRA